MRDQSYDVKRLFAFCVQWSEDKQLTQVAAASEWLPHTTGLLQKCIIVTIYRETFKGLKVPSIFKSMKSEENPITAEILFNSTFVFSWRLFSVACQILFFFLSCLTLSYEITKHNQLEGWITVVYT